MVSCPQCLHLPGGHAGAARGAAGLGGGAAIAAAARARRRRREPDAAQPLSRAGRAEVQPAAARARTGAGRETGAGDAAACAGAERAAGVGRATVARLVGDGAVVGLTFVVGAVAACESGRCVPGLLAVAGEAGAFVVGAAPGLAGPQDAHWLAPWPSRACRARPRSAWPRLGCPGPSEHRVARCHAAGQDWPARSPTAAAAVHSSRPAEVVPPGAPGRVRCDRVWCGTRSAHRRASGPATRLRSARPRQIGALHRRGRQLRRGRDRRAAHRRRHPAAWSCAGVGLGLLITVLMTVVLWMLLNTMLFGGGTT